MGKVRSPTQLLVLDVNFQVPKIMNLLKLTCLLLLIAICLITVSEGFRLAQSQDSYPWTNCNAFESTKKNCPRGEACLKLKSYQSYAWNWAMSRTRGIYLQISVPIRWSQIEMKSFFSTVLH